ELENTMHRAVLLASGSELGPEAVLLTGESMVASVPASAPPPPSPAAPSPASPSAAAATPVSAPPAAARPAAATTSTSGLVGRTVADVERDLIIDTLGHCLGNRTHAANIL